ncbi:MAG: adenosine kinase [Actinomycetota bacterium]
MLTPQQPIDVLAVGNAIVDVLVHCDDGLLDKFDLKKGTMSLVDAERADEIYAAIGPGIEISGGSAANTATGVASLGGHSAFIGKVRDDELGDIFRHDLRATGVTYDVAAATAGRETARCLVLVTPDAQRTMATYLGTAGELRAEDVDPDLVARSAVTFIEGYLVGLPAAAPALAAAVSTARREGRRVALTLSDPDWVEAQRPAFAALLEDVDVVLANESEACRLTRESDAVGALEALAERYALVAVTCSERGAYVTDGSETLVVPPERVGEVVDTTGAGDLFASGFLLGIARGLPLADAGRLGALAAAEAIAHLGARPQVGLAALAQQAGLSLPPRNA